MTNEEYRTELRNAVKQARETRYKNSDYGDVCLAAAKLIECSDFGRKEAKSELVLRLDIDVESDIADNAAIKLLEISSYYLGKLGRVSVVPLSRSAEVSFKPNQ